MAVALFKLCMNVGMSISGLILGEVAPNPNIAANPAQPKGVATPANAQSALVSTDNPEATGGVDTANAGNIPVFIQAQQQSFQDVLSEAIAGQVQQNGENIPAITGQKSENAATTENKPVIAGELVQPDSELLQFLQNTAAGMIVGKPLTETVSGNPCPQQGDTKNTDKTAEQNNVVMVQGLPVVIAEPVLNPAEANPEEVILPVMQSENETTSIPNTTVVGAEVVEATVVEADKPNIIAAVSGEGAKKDSGSVSIPTAKIPVAGNIPKADGAAASLIKDTAVIADKPANANIQNPTNPQGQIVTPAPTGQQTPALNTDFPASPADKPANANIQNPTNPQGQIVAPAPTGQQTPALNTDFPASPADLAGLQAGADQVNSEPDKQPAGKSTDNQRGHTLSEASAEIVKGFQNTANNVSDGKNGQMANQPGADSSSQPFIQILQNHIDTTAGSNSNPEQILTANGVQQTIVEQPPPQIPVADTLPQGQQKQQFMDQIFESIQSSVQQDSKQITIRLNPPELGKVFIKFQENNGHIIGVLRVSEAQTRYEIEKALPQLIQNLVDSGVVIKRLDVVMAEQPQQPLKEQFTQNGQENWANQHNLPEGNNGQRRNYTDEWGTNSGYGGAEADMSGLSDSFITDKSMNVLV